MNSTANQSSSCWCVGCGARVPKSSGVSTRPAPKIACQTRFTWTRAVSGERRSDNHLAKVRRVGGAFSVGRCKNAGVCGSTRFLWRFQTPRSRTKVSRPRFRKPFPVRFDLVVERHKFRDARTPRGKDFGALLGSALIPGRLHRQHGSVRRRVDFRVGGSRQRETKPADHRAQVATAFAAVVAAQAWYARASRGQRVEVVAGGVVAVGIIF